MGDGGMGETGWDGGRINVGVIGRVEWVGKWIGCDLKGWGVGRVMGKCVCGWG